MSYLDEDGEHKTAYDIDGMSIEAALGYLVAVSDRIREEKKFDWDTCPHCKEPWEDHDGPGVYDQDDDDEGEWP